MKFAQWYNKNYKFLLVIPFALIIFSLASTGYFYSQNGDFLKRDVSLIGGTSITLKTDISASELQEKLSGQFADIEIRTLADNSGKQTYLVITVPDSKEILVTAIEHSLEIKLTEENSSIEYTGGSLGQEFYKQLLTAMFFAFLLMALVVFLTFGESKLIKVYTSLLTLIALKLTFPTISQISFLFFLSLIIVFFYGIYIAKSKNHRLLLTGVFASAIFLAIFSYYFIIFPIALICLILYAKYSAPSIAVIISAFADIIFTVATINILGTRVSAGGIVAFLMLIGYSVGTDILLTSRVLRRKNESVNSACIGAFKTGITMTLTTLVAIFVALLFVYRFETVLNQIFMIILIGLLYDILNTWLTNVLIIKWYAETRDKK
jgi:preprotein translocase subunit SecF